MFMAKYLLFIALTLFTHLAYAQIHLEGHLINEASEPLPFANILVQYEADTSLYKGFISDENGHFAFEIPNDSFLLQFNFLGLHPLTLSADSVQKLEGPITLSPLSNQLTSVEVTAAKPLLQRLEDRLLVQVSDSPLSLGSNTLDILQRSPGIIVDQDGNISINGRSGVRIYLDGKDLRLSGDQLSSFLEGLTASNIERIEIITNPSAKYEAQGNAGIVDIITKKGLLMGTNGSISLSPGLGRYFRWENNISFNHRRKKLNLYGQYNFAKRNQYMEIIIDRKFLENGAPREIIDMQTLFRLPIETHAPRLGLDYEISQNTTVGILVNAFSNITGQISDNEIISRDESSTPKQFQLTDGNTKTNWHQFNSNVNLSHTFSNQGKLKFDLNYARYDNGSDQTFDSRFLRPDETLLLENSLIGNVNGQLDLLGLAIDYSTPLGSNKTFEIGWKNTLVNTDNDLEYFDVENDVTSINEGLSNRFIYHEEIYGAYANLRFKQERWNGSIGLRAEKTAIEGDQRSTDEKFTNNYLNIFPTASINYSLHQNHTLGFSVSRRLDRPGYNDLNPFRFFVNNYTYRVGNPFLTPQFTWSAEVNYTFKQRYYFAINYGLTTDNLNRAIFQEGTEDIVVVKPINIDDLNSLGIVASLPIQFTKKWSSQWNLNLSLNDYQGEIGGFTFDRLNTIFVLNTNHSISLGKGLRIQLGGFYLPSHYASISKIKDISQISVGLQKSILQNRGSIRFNFNDIFYQGYPRGRTVFGRIDDTFISKRDTRFATLAFSYNFGKQTVKSQRRRSTRIEEELQRARQQDQ